ncbi:hypothetical protein [Dyella tabacisoli]|uniref:Uncharacterized protein n=1 Tax=Dyella tabacisoli TaxID=2282381 RepID=A0A369UL23_9GAMM|nr:hypothetical protein [Dyella tabacisoli]RDD81207.1 hypothetical protein DVJ77_12855 [Dyella tabacisoli]
MKTFYWLVKREYWEHRGGFLWAPIVTGGIFVLLNIMGIITAEVFGARHGLMIGGNNELTQLVAKANAGDLAQVGNALDLAFISSMAIISVVLGFVVLFYCLGSLYDDRRDHSVLFWKSLPISDTTTVLSKVVSATVLAPIIAVVVSIALGMLLIMIFALVLSFHGVSAWQLLSQAHPLRATISLLCAIPLYALWALPAVGWLMLCSVWARTKPFLWAVLIPALTGLMISWFGIMNLLNLSSSWFWTHIFQRILISVFPVSSLQSYNIDVESFSHVHQDGPLALIDPIRIYSLLASPGLWIGVIAGAVLIIAAIRLRRARDDS